MVTSKYNKPIINYKKVNLIINLFCIWSVFEIDRIVDKDVCEEGSVIYKVHWINWPAKWDSWLSREEINADELINEFEQQLQQKPEQNMEEDTTDEDDNDDDDDEWWF